MSDNITLPREVVEKAVKAFENGCPPTCENGMVDSGGFHPWGQPALVPCPACLAFEHLRTALAAEPTKPKPEPVAAQHRFRLALPAAHWALKIGSPDWGPWHACKVSNRPSWEIDLQGWEVEYRPLYAAPPEDDALRRDAERYRWLRDWLDNNGLLIRAIRGESLAGYEHPDIEALRRDAERYRWLREKDGIAVDVTVFGSMEANLDAAIDAAMKEGT